MGSTSTRPRRSLLWVLRRANFVLLMVAMIATKPGCRSDLERAWLRLYLLGTWAVASTIALYVIPWLLGSNRKRVNGKPES